jgi:hypothetical protein
MAIKLIKYSTLSMLFVIMTFSCSYPQSKKNETTIENERLQLRNYALCKCLKYCLPNGDSLMIKDGSVAGYFEKGVYSIDVYSKIDSVTKITALKHYPSKSGKNLGLMKCIDFYNSKELIDLVRSLDSELDESKLKD